MDVKSNLSVLKVISPSKLLTALIFFQSTICFADYQTLFQQLVDQKQAQVQKMEQDQNAPLTLQENIERRKTELKIRLDELQVQLKDILQQISDLDSEVKTLTDHQATPEKDLTLEDWDQIFAIRQIGLCKVEGRDKDGFYKIADANGKLIRFKPFQDVNKESSSYAQFSGTVDNSAIDIVQPAYALKNKKINMEGKVSYTIKDNTLIFGHVSFLGERLNDKLFGGSSHDAYSVVCKTGFTQLD